MSKFFKILVMFQSGERVSRKRLLKLVSQELIDEAEFMVKYMMEKREVEIKELIVKKATTTVECIASVVASVVYLEE